MLNTQTHLTVPVQVAVKSIRYLLPMCDAAFTVVEKNEGRSHMPLAFKGRLKAIGIEDWAEHYLDQRRVILLSLLGTYSVKQLEDIGSALYSADKATQDKFWADLIEYYSTPNWIDEWVEGEISQLTPVELKAQFEELMGVVDETLRLEIGASIYGHLIGTTTSFYNTISVMAYGRPIAHLLAMAMNGDLSAYYRAYHVDDSIARLPQFANLHNKMKEELNDKFFSALSLRRRKPIFSSKEIKNPKLWFVFAHLDNCGVLPSKQPGRLTMEELLDLCIELKVYGAEHDKGVDDLSKRLRDYRNRKFTTV